MSGRGRPTDYDPDMCDRVEEWGKEGKSRAWMCAELGIARSTMQLWQKNHPEFSAALERAKVYEQKWWEDHGQTNLATQGYQASMWSRSMAARFPDEWREKSEVKVSLTQEDALDQLE